MRCRRDQGPVEPDPQLRTVPGSGDVDPLPQREVLGNDDGVALVDVDGHAEPQRRRGATEEIDLEAVEVVAVQRLGQHRLVLRRHGLDAEPTRQRQSIGCQQVRCRGHGDEVVDAIEDRSVTHHPRARGGARRVVAGSTMRVHRSIGGHRALELVESQPQHQIGVERLTGIGSARSRGLGGRSRGFGRTRAARTRRRHGFGRDRGLHVDAIGGHRGPGDVQRRHRGRIGGGGRRRGGRRIGVIRRDTLPSRGSAVIAVPLPRRAVLGRKRAEAVELTCPAPRGRHTVGRLLALELGARPTAPEADEHRDEQPGTHHREGILPAGSGVNGIALRKQRQAGIASHHPSTTAPAPAMV